MKCCGSAGHALHGVRVESGKLHCTQPRPLALAVVKSFLLGPLGSFLGSPSYTLVTSLTPVLHSCPAFIGWWFKPSREPSWPPKSLPELELFTPSLAFHTL